MFVNWYLIYGYKCCYVMLRYVTLVMLRYIALRYVMLNSQNVFLARKIDNYSR